MAMNIKKGDTVVVLSGKDKGKKGKVLSTMPKAGKVIVEGINVATIHNKARKQGEESGIIRKEQGRILIMDEKRLWELM